MRNSFPRTTRATFRQERLTAFVKTASIVIVTKSAELIGAQEACQIVGIKRSTLTYWMLTGRLTPTQTINGIGSRAVAHLFDRAEVERLAAERRSA